MKKTFRIFLFTALASLTAAVPALADNAAPSAGFNAGQAAVIAIVVGLIVGLITALVLKGQLKSVYRKNEASDYTRPNSMKITMQRDRFLYSHVDRTEKPQNNDAAKKAPGGAPRR